MIELLYYGQHHTTFTLAYLENLRPLLCAVIDGEDYDAAMINGGGYDEESIRNDQFTSTRNPA